MSKIFQSLLILSLLAGTAHAKKQDPRDLVDRIEKVLVEKSKRKLHLIVDGEILKTYGIAMGWNPVGHKVQEGDERTPEGTYKIEYKNPNSKFHLSLKIDYPNSADRKHAKSLGVSPGGNIMIHGTPNVLKEVSDIVQLFPWWTDGCIAVTNKNIEEIYDLVPVGAEIEITP